MFTNKLQADTPRTLDRLEPEYYVLLQVIRQTLVPKAGYKEGLNAIHQTVLHALAEMLDFDLVDLMIGKMEDVICDSFAQRHALPYAHFISRILSLQDGGYSASHLPGSRSTDQYPSTTLAEAAEPSGLQFSRCLPRREQVQTEAEQIARFEATMPSYLFVSSGSDPEYIDSENEILSPFTPRAHDAEAGGSGAAPEPTPPPVTQSQVSQPD